jgi:hypothetical protein
MSCWFKRHKFIHTWDQIVGGCMARHLYCKKCGVQWDILWIIEKQFRRSGKRLRFKVEEFY